MIKHSPLAALFLSFVLHANTGVAVTVPSAQFPTIQSAINAVVAGSLANGTVIDVNPGTYTEFLLVNATNKSMTVRGLAGPASTVVAAPAAGVSVLRVLNATGTVRFEGLTVRNGNGGPSNGGGFTLVNSSPTFFNCVFFGNVATPSGGGGVLSNAHAVFDTTVFQSNAATSFGGGVVIVSGSRPTFINSQFVGNVSGTSDPVGSGGAVHVNDASPTFRNTTFNANQSKFAGGAIEVIGVYGNAAATVVLEDCVISNNVSVAAAGQNPSEGGGVSIEDNTVAYLTRTRVVNNTAGTGGGINAYRARFDVAHSIIEGNTASSAVTGFGGGIGATSNNTGGTIRPGSVIVLNDTVVRGNSGRIGGGIQIGGDRVCNGGTCTDAGATKATLTIVDSLIFGNTASDQGGAVVSDRVVVSIDRSHILNNVATNFYGGGLSIFGATQATINETTIANNTAGQFGGGIYVDIAAVLNVTNSRFYKNSAGAANANAGGGIWAGGQNSPTGTISNSVFADNTNYQIGEYACATPGTPNLTYTNNNVVPPGDNKFYYGTCTAAASSIAALNALPKASGNTSTAPTFAQFLATPGIGPSVLSWAVARATNVIAGGVSSSNPVGARDVSPTTRTTYTMTSTPTTGTHSAEVTALVEWGVPGDSAVPADYDGDGKQDTAVFRPSTGQWFIVRSSTGQVAAQEWGVAAAGDRPVPADYDGDGKSDIAVYRQTTGEWFILGSAGATLAFKWGEPTLGDVPVPGDYDGDGKVDAAVYRTSSGQWFVRTSSGGFIGRNWGVPAAGDTPVPADYDGDGTTDFAVFRTSTGHWFIQPASGAPSTATLWGVPSLQDVPVPADYDGDGKTDVAVMRQTTGQWFVVNSSGGTSVSQWGAGAARVPGDYNFDHNADLAVWLTNGKWAVQR